MPRYLPDDPDPAEERDLGPPPPVQFADLLAEVPQTIADNHPAMERARSGFYDGVLNHERIGVEVVRCPGCDTERWYGHGACGECGHVPTAPAWPAPSLSDPDTLGPLIGHILSERDRGVPAGTVLPPPPNVVQSPQAPPQGTGPEPDLAQPVPAPAPPEDEPIYGTPPDDDDPAFAGQVAEALEKLAPQSGQELAPHQVPPQEHEDSDSAVTGWVMMAGRNAGKTYAGARWLHARCSMRAGVRARIIAPSFGDAVASCIEGPSGILAASNYQVTWKPSHAGGAQLQWPNGSVCYVIGTPTPRDVDRLRAIGNVDYDWFEEAAANPQLEEAERQARLSRRRKGAKWIGTTTPRPLKTIRAWKKDATVAISAATAHDNKHADPLWLEELENMYKGTRLYAQEVLGQVLEDVEGALWRIDHLDRSRVLPDLAAFHEMLLAEGRTIARAAVGVDPANSTGTTGIVAVVMTNDRHLYIVDDESQPGRSADQWARAAVDLALRWDAVLVPENDSGGDAIRAVLKAADLLDEVTIMPATARGRGGKGARAEPIALLWERDDFRGHIVGSHPFLEDQMTTWVPDVTGQDSPDRMDAMVWASTYLWGRASFRDVSTQFPGSVANTGNAAVRRPGEMIRWHKSKGRQRERMK